MQAYGNFYEFFKEGQRYLGIAQGVTWFWADFVRVSFLFPMAVWAAGGLSALLRSPKRAAPRPAVAPKVALPVQGRLPFCPLRGSCVNPCRVVPFGVWGLKLGLIPVTYIRKILRRYRRDAKFCVSTCFAIKRGTLEREMG